MLTTAADGRLPRLLCVSSVALAALSGACAFAQMTPDEQTLQIAAGVPLHVQTIRTAPLRVGAVVDGLLTDPIYVHDRLLLPQNTPVHGVVSRLVPAERGLRTRALLDGDVTPLREPVVRFSVAHLNGRDVALDSTARIREAQLVQFTPAKKRSLRQRGSDLARERVHSVREQVTAPGKKDRVLRLLYSQLPYHPQRIWAGTRMIADLESPADVRMAAEPVTPLSTADATTLDKITVRARLTTGLSSDSSHHGDAVRAVVTAPVLDGSHAMVLPEGAELAGTVSEVKRSRSFGRNGQLRFAFQSVERTGEDAQRMHGTLTAAEAPVAQNITIDSEGQAKANPDRNRFIAPLLLAVTAAAGHDRDSDGGVGRAAVASNGFGLVARVVSIAVNDRNVSTGFGAYGFAKSVYYRFLQRGHAVTFPKDTLVEVQLAAR